MAAASPSDVSVDIISEITRQKDPSPSTPYQAVNPVPCSCKGFGQKFGSNCSSYRVCKFQCHLNL